MNSERKNILIVDDEPGCLESFRMILGIKDYIVSTYSNGPDALNAAKETRYDIAFIDDLFPIKNGLEVIKELKAISPSTKIIFTTAASSWSIILKAIECGAFTGLRKPFAMEEVFAMCEDDYRGEDLESIKSKAILENKIRQTEGKKSLLINTIAIISLIITSISIWDPYEHTFEENLKWAWLRAIEWACWPLFVSQSIAPVLFLFYPWQIVFVSVVIATLLWRNVRYRYFSVILANWGVVISLPKWILAIGIGIYFLVIKNYFLFFLCTFWPIVVMPLQMLAKPYEVRTMQNKIMNILGYKKG